MSINTFNNILSKPAISTQNTLFSTSKQGVGASYQKQQEQEQNNNIVSFQDYIDNGKKQEQVVSSFDCYHYMYVVRETLKKSDVLKDYKMFMKKNVEERYVYLS